MKKVIVGFASVVLAAGLTTTAVAATDNGSQIGVVNVQKIFSDSPSVKATKANLMKAYGAKKSQVEAAGKALQAMMADYKKNASVMSASDKEALQTKISAKQSSIVSMESSFQQQAAQDEQKAMAKFVNQVQKAAQKVAQQKHLSLIIPEHGVVYAADDLDVTAAVESEFNKM